MISPGAFAALEREYLRFGVLGMFLFRMLPAFRSVVAPFAGLVNLSPARALLPIMLASGIWYAAMTLLGSQLGSRWETIDSTAQASQHGARHCGRMALVLVVVWFLRRRRAGHEARIESLIPFDPLHPDRAVPIMKGFPTSPADALEEARRQRQERPPDP